MSIRESTPLEDLADAPALLRQTADWYDIVYPKLYLPRWWAKWLMRFVAIPLPNSGNGVQDSLRRWADAIEEAM